MAPSSWASSFKSSTSSHRALREDLLRVMPLVVAGAIGLVGDDPFGSRAQGASKVAEHWAA